MLGGACHTALPAGRADVPAGDLFPAAETKRDLARLLEAAPRRCVSLGPEAEACEWRIGAGHPRYEELSARLGVSDRIGILCVLPAHPAPLDPDSCWLQQRRTNRGRYAVSSRMQARASAMAFNEVQDAGTLLEMIRLLGQLPEQCIERGRTRRVCEWLLTSRSYGHGTIARVVDAQPHQKVYWVCRFPMDGRRRPPRSCEGEGL